MANELIRISQNRFTVSDMMRMEKIILEKLYWKVKAPTALHFLRLFYSCIQDTLEDDWYVDCRLGRYTVYVPGVSNMRHAGRILHGGVHNRCVQSDRWFEKRTKGTNSVYFKTTQID